IARRQGPQVLSDLSMGQALLSADCSTGVKSAFAGVSSGSAASPCPPGDQQQHDGNENPEDHEPHPAARIEILAHFTLRFQSGDPFLELCRKGFSHVSDPPLIPPHHSSPGEKLSASEYGNHQKSWGLAAESI